MGKYEHYYCKQSAKLFVLANARGYDSARFVRTLLNADIAPVFYNNDCSTNWLGETYVMAVLEDELRFAQGDTYSDDFMYWAGYLYRAWSMIYDDTPREIYLQAPPETLAEMFLGLHVMSYELAIMEIKEHSECCEQCVAQCPALGS